MARKSRKQIAVEEPVIESVTSQGFSNHPSLPFFRLQNRKE